MTARTRRHNLSKLTATGNVERATPPDVFAWLDEQFGFTLDVASTHANALCRNHFTREDNGLAQGWYGHIAFMNPPFGKGIGDWVCKANETCRGGDGVEVVACVLPSRVDADWWRKWVAGQWAWNEAPRVDYNPATTVLALRWSSLRVHVWHFGERVKFDGLKQGAPFPTAVVVFSALKARRPSKPKGNPIARPWFGEVWL